MEKRRNFLPVVDFHVRTGTRFSFRDKRLFLDKRLFNKTRVDCIHLGTLIYHYDDSISLHRSILSRRQQREDLEPVLYLPWIWPVTIMSTPVGQTILTIPNASV